MPGLEELSREELRVVVTAQAQLIEQLSARVEQLTVQVADLTRRLGQDLEVDEAGVFRIARRVRKDRVISTVDPQARHGHKTEDGSAP